MSLAKLGAGEDRVTHLFYCDASAAHQPNADPIHMAINGALYINVIALLPHISAWTNTAASSRYSVTVGDVNPCISW